MIRPSLLFICILASSVSHAGPQDLLQRYAAEAKQENPKFQGFSPSRGDQFFHAAHPAEAGKRISCATCHTDDPKSAGRNEKTGKDIRPMAPVVNAERLSDSTKVEKWFKRNCNDVLARACTAQEKGDFVAYLQSIK